MSSATPSEEAVGDNKMKTQFTTDNTTGFTATELSELNKKFQTLLAIEIESLGEFCTDDTIEQIKKSLADKLLNDFVR